MKNYWIRDGIEKNIFDVIRFVDILVLFVAAYLTYFMRQGSFAIPENYIGFIIIYAIIFSITCNVCGLYKLKCLHSLSRQASLLIWSIIVPVVICLSIAFLMGVSDNFSRIWLVSWQLLSFGLLCVERYAFSAWFRSKLNKGCFVRKAVLVGHSVKTEKLMRVINKPARSIVEAVAIYLPDYNGDEKEQLGLPIINNMNDLEHLCYKEKIDDVIVTYEMDSQEGIDDILSDLRVLPCNVLYCLPTILFDRVSPERLWGAPIISIYRRPIGDREVFVKRIFDILIALGLIVLFLPVLIACSLILKLNKSESILFNQSRNGMMGEEFNIYKFRTMSVTDAGDGDVKQAQKHDPRVTKVGAFLRKTSMDELPQLFNVLRGDMSIVGPRPHAVSHNDHYDNLVESYAARNRVKPGITGWAQIHGCRGETDTLDKMKKRVAYDLYYIENWSLLMDLKVMLLTPFALFHKNAY